MSALPHRPTCLALAASLLCMTTLLLGCHSRPAPPPSAAEREATDLFSRHAQAILMRDMGKANVRNLSGVLRLKIRLAADNSTTGCDLLSVDRVRDAPLLLAANRRGKSPSSTALKRLVIDQCWKSVYPKAPASLRDADGTVEIIAPLVMQSVVWTEADKAQARTRGALHTFMRQQVLVGERVDSIGQASLLYRTDAHGTVEACIVNLTPLAARPEAFRPDADLQTRLARRCMGLDLSQVPALARGDDGRIAGTVQLDYAPWSVNRP
ncbi:hypothetical protein G7007_06010 [Pseudomonas entomophila]|jgi:hypothetical protein|uniref:hypothetical protein n=1 Tax=Pseudomonas entomophila TaxID=312306 RepID=UPI0015E2F212|nr:hypothetical protein [Pseudomonas entomophila]MBA1192416.1 hypothetical protein [Pseudomonas entomophila]